MKPQLSLFNWPDQLRPMEQVGFDHLVEAAALLPFYFWPGKSAHSNDEGRRNVAKLKRQAGLQSVWNVWLDQELRARGFHAEVPVRPAEVSDAQRLDHAFQVEDGRLLCVENEFGNSSHTDSNCLKFLEAFNWDRAALCVMVCVTARTAAVTTGGCVTFESAVQRLERLTQRTLSFPLAVIGLDYEHSEQVDLSASCVPNADLLSGNSDKRVLWHVVSEHRAGVPVEHIGMPSHADLRIASVEHRRAVPTAQNSLF